MGSLQLGYHPERVEKVWRRNDKLSQRDHRRRKIRGHQRCSQVSHELRKINQERSEKLLEVTVNGLGPRKERANI
jgi:hypothetical protein